MDDGFFIFARWRDKIPLPLRIHLRLLPVNPTSKPECTDTQRDIFALQFLEAQTRSISHWLRRPRCNIQKAKSNLPVGVLFRGDIIGSDLNQV